MSDPREDRLKDVAALTKAIENVFRKLIRFLVGRISLVKLQEMISYIYIEETEEKLQSAYPGKNVPLTKLALATGLDTRTVSGVRKKIAVGDHLYKQQFLRDLTPESAIVDAWANFIGQCSNETKHLAQVLSYGDENGTFERLVRSTISARGITTQSVLERLCATKSVRIDKSKKTVELVVETFSPYLSNDEQEMVNSALSAISNLISTIEHNVDVSPEEKLFQRQVWTFRLNPQKLSALRIKLTEFLETTEYSTRKLIEPWESEFYDDKQVIAGAGFYYFEEKNEKP